MSQRSFQINQKIIDNQLEMARIELDKTKNNISFFRKKKSDLEASQKKISSYVEYIEREEKRVSTLFDLSDFSYVTSFDFKSEELNAKEVLSDIKLHIEHLGLKVGKYESQKVFLEKDIELLLDLTL